MSDILDTDQSELVKRLADKLKEIDTIKAPEYIKFVKSGAGRERLINDADSFWYIRAASILRRLYVNGPTGVSRFRSIYGNKKAHVVHRMHHVKASGSIIRRILQQLEKAGLVEKTKEGRKITAKGAALLKESALIARGAKQ
ncbi:MAG: 30S ribosomal protein S19e [Candidatus Micrarchaeota archaeon]|nr:MAG: 30S ribosomal protein S19e [Candidatus Micrarchaeota archaeon]